MYNLVADQWFIQRGMTENVPITVPSGSGTLTVRAKIMGLGMTDGPEVVFRYTYKSAPSAPVLLDQAPPQGLTGGILVINGTTTAMEYNTSASASSGWKSCSNGSTQLTAGTYHVRYKATETHNPSPAVQVIVAEEIDISGAVISVYIGGRIAKAFSQSDIAAMPKHGPSTYSGHNTWPAYETLSGVSGVRVMDLLSAAGASGLSSGQSIRFTSSDGFSASVTVRQLEEPRYFHDSNGTRGAQLPSVINVAQGGDYRRLAFGQAAAGEQVRQAHVKDVVRIDVDGNAGSWGSPNASPASGSSVSKGSLIRLALPSGQGDAKIYYTLDGSEPSRNSKIYNIVADRWLFQRGMNENTPISAPDGAFTIKAKIIGIGKNDGPTVSFTYSKQEKKPDSKIATPTIDELKNGEVTIAPGNSVFVPGAIGSVTWDPDEMDGYYDEELGGYVLTPKEGVEGTVRFTYTDEDGVEHTLSVEVDPGAADELLPIEDAEESLAAGIGSGSNDTGSGIGAAGGGNAAGMPQWLLIALCAACAAACAVFIRKKKPGKNVA